MFYFYRFLIEKETNFPNFPQRFSKLVAPQYRIYGNVGIR